jgi:DNA-nicking Smr family endonuclease
LGVVPLAPDLPFPDSLCHGCVAHRIVPGKASAFILCTALAVKYPPQPQRACAAFRAPSVAAAPTDAPGPHEIPIDGELDLHSIHPSEVRDVVAEYLLACQARGIRELRIVHGKGTGAQRRSVHALLARSPLVAACRTADEQAGGWGATLVTLHVAG